MDEYQGKVLLDGAAYFAVDEVQCGLIRAHWLSGTMLSDGYFISHRQYAKNLRKRAAAVLRGKPEKRSAKDREDFRALLRLAAQYREQGKDESEICAPGPDEEDEPEVPVATPTRTLSPSQTPVASQTPSIPPTPVGTEGVSARALCSQEPRNERRWSIVNDNAHSVTLGWEIEEGTQRGELQLTPFSTVRLVTATEPVDNTLRLFIGTALIMVVSSTTTICSTPTPVNTPTTVPTRAATNTPTLPAPTPTPVPPAPTFTATFTPSYTPTASATRTYTHSPTATKTATSTPLAASPSPTRTATPLPSLTPTPEVWITPGVVQPSGLFTMSTFMTSYEWPHHAVIADIDGDNRRDIVTVHGRSSDLRLFIGQGNGTFGTQITVPVGSNPQWIVARDLNGDELPELVVANASTSDVSLFLNQGDGTLLELPRIPVGSGPQFVELADVTEDGIPDLLTANGSNSLTLRAGLGGTNFGASVTLTYPTLRSPMSLRAYDATFDGHVDLLVPSYSSATGQHAVLLLVGNGQGQFTLAAEYPVQNSPLYLDLGDLNEDGIADMVVGNYGYDSLSVLFGVVSGGFGPATHVRLGISYPRGVRIHDFNGDGHLDVAVVRHVGRAVVFYKGDGTGNLSYYTAVNTGASPYPFAFGDLNGDSLLDFAVPSYIDNGVAVYLAGAR